MFSLIHNKFNILKFVLYYVYDIYIINICFDSHLNDILMFDDCTSCSLFQCSQGCHGPMCETDDIVDLLRRDTEGFQTVRR